MLKLIDPLLGADVLHALRSMGHGDDVVICDMNFPSDSLARGTSLGHLLHMGTDSIPRAARAILSLMPLDTFVDRPALRMEVVGKQGEVQPIMSEVQQEIDRAEGKSWPMGTLERFAFYERAGKAYCIIRTNERRFYGCYIFKKGVVPPDA